MATNANPIEGWIRFHELQARINAELEKMTPDASKREVPWSITSRQLKAILASAPAEQLWHFRTKQRLVRKTSALFSPELVHPLTLLAAAQLNGKPFSPKMMKFLFATEVFS